MVIENRELKHSKPSLRKVFLSLFTLLFVATGLFAQNLENESEIKEYLGRFRFEQNQVSNPGYLTFLDARCSSGFKIVELASEKTEGMTVVQNVTYSEWVPSLKEEEKKLNHIDVTITPEEFIENSNTSNFNFLKYHFQFDSKKMSYYVLGNTGMVLMIYPVEYVSSLINSNN